MSYLLTQLFTCLLGTAILFFLLGWLLRARSKGRSDDEVIADTERGSWQTSLDIFKSRLEIETSSRMETEMALADLRAQQSDSCTLLDQNAAKLRGLSQQVSEQSQALAERDTSLGQMQTHVAELESRESFAQDLINNLRAQISENTPRLAAAADARAELLALRARIADLEPKLKAATANSVLIDSLQTEVQSLRAELDLLRLQVEREDEELSRITAIHQEPSVRNVATPVLPADRDDLKKIHGIGPVLEKRLNGLGIYYFREIAGWSKDDVLRFEGHLKEFRRRIERDNWIEGAADQHFKKYGERLLQTQPTGATDEISAVS